MRYFDNKYSEVCKRKEISFGVSGFTGRGEILGVANSEERQRSREALGGPRGKWTSLAGAEASHRRDTKESKNRRWGQLRKVLNSKLKIRQYYVRFKQIVRCAVY